MRGSGLLFMASQHGSLGVSQATSLSGTSHPFSNSCGYWQNSVPCCYVDGGPHIFAGCQLGIPLSSYRLTYSEVHPFTTYPPTSSVNRSFYSSLFRWGLIWSTYGGDFLTIFVIFYWFQVSAWFYWTWKGIDYKRACMIHWGSPQHSASHTRQ